MDIIEQHIRETKEVIESKDLEKAERQYNFLLAVYGKKILDYEQGTSALQAKENMVWNMNGLNLPIVVDYISDLKLVVEKIILYNQEQESININNISANNIGRVKIEDKSINVLNSQIQNSSIGQENEGKKGLKNIWKVIGGIIGGLAGISTVLTLIFKLCGML